MCLSACESLNPVMGSAMPAGRVLFVESWNHKGRPTFPQQL